MAEGGQRPFGNDEDLVADGLHLGEDMGAENDSVALSKLLDQISDLDDLNGVKADGRLIRMMTSGLPSSACAMPTRCR